MANWYDRIIQENVEQVLAKYVFNAFGINPLRVESVKTIIHSTIKRECDFLKKVWVKGYGTPVMIHIEFQSTEDSDMLFRMLEYRAFIEKKFTLPVWQYVVYLGRKPWRHPTLFKGKNLVFSYKLIELRKYPVSQFIKSDLPEIVLTGLFSDFGKRNASKVINLILRRLVSLSETDEELQKYLIQLKVLSNLVKIQDVVLEVIKTMPITYDLKSDLIYQQGMQQGMEEGTYQEKLKTAKKLVDEGLSVEFVVRVTGLAESVVQKLCDASSRRQL